MKTKDIILIILAVLLVVSFGYIGYGKYQNDRLSLFKQGGQQGYQYAITQIVHGVSTCQEVPLTVGNKTINIVAVSCLKTQKSTK